MKKSLREFLLDKWTKEELRRTSKNDPDPKGRTAEQVAQDRLDDHFSYEFLETITDYINYRLGEEI